MPNHPPVPCDRIAEAEHFISQARGLLDQSQEEIVVNYLDHAIEALRIVSEQRASDEERPFARAALSVPVMAPAEDLG